MTHAFWVLPLLQLVFPEGIDSSTYPKVYQCEIKTLVQVYDADTITKPTCDLGMGVSLQVNPGLRSQSIDAYEVRGAEKEKGRPCRDELRAAIKANDMKFLFVASIDKKGREVKDKYGRPVGHVFVNGENMALAALRSGCAVQKEY